MNRDRQVKSQQGASQYKITDPDFCCGLTSPNDTDNQNNIGLPSLRPRSHNRGSLCPMFLKRETS